jgi:hypothetical protein
MKELSRKELNKHLEKYILEHTELSPHFKAKLGKCPIHKGDGETLKVYPESFECVVCGAKGDILWTGLGSGRRNDFRTKNVLLKTSTALGLLLYS